MNLEAVIEGILFVLGEDGITLDNLIKVLEVSESEAIDALNNLRHEYEKENRGIRIHFLGDRLKLTTKKIHKNYYQKLIEVPETNNLSQSALETLAIIAYNQPITRIKVDEIRGISSQQMIRKLVAKNLIKEVGRSNEAGRPILYKTTSDFLDYFGLATIDDLPKIEMKIEDDKEVDLYQSKYREEEEIL